MSNLEGFYSPLVSQSKAGERSATQNVTNRVVTERTYTTAYNNISNGNQYAGNAKNETKSEGKQGYRTIGGSQLENKQISSTTYNMTTYNSPSVPSTFIQSNYGSPQQPVSAFNLKTNLGTTTEPKSQDKKFSTATYEYRRINSTRGDVSPVNFLMGQLASENGEQRDNRSKFFGNYSEQGRQNTFVGLDQNNIRIPNTNEAKVLNGQGNDHIKIVEGNNGVQQSFTSHYQYKAPQNVTVTQSREVNYRPLVNKVTFASNLTNQNLVNTGVINNAQISPNNAYGKTSIERTNLIGQSNTFPIYQRPVVISQHQSSQAYNPPGVILPTPTHATYQSSSTVYNQSSAYPQPYLQAQNISTSKQNLSSVQQNSMANTKAMYQMIDQVERPKYNKLYGIQDDQVNQRVIVEQDPPLKSSICGPVCFIPLLCIGLLLGLFGMLCGLGILCAGSFSQLKQAPQPQKPITPVTPQTPNITTPVVVPPVTPNNTIDWLQPQIIKYNTTTDNYVIYATPHVVTWETTSYDNSKNVTAINSIIDYTANASNLAAKVTNVVPYNVTSNFDNRWNASSSTVKIQSTPVIPIVPIVPVIPQTIQNPPNPPTTPFQPQFIHPQTQTNTITTVSPPTSSQTSTISSASTIQQNYVQLPHPFIHPEVQITTNTIPYASTSLESSSRQDQTSFIHPQLYTTTVTNVSTISTQNLINSTKNQGSSSTLNTITEFPVQPTSNDIKIQSNGVNATYPQGYITIVEQTTVLKPTQTTNDMSDFRNTTVTSSDESLSAQISTQIPTTSPSISSSTTPATLIIKQNQTSSQLEPSPEIFHIQPTLETTSMTTQTVNLTDITPSTVSSVQTVSSNSDSSDASSSTDTYSLQPSPFITTSLNNVVNTNTNSQAQSLGLDSIPMTSPDALSVNASGNISNISASSVQSVALTNYTKNQTLSTASNNLIELAPSLQTKTVTLTDNFNTSQANLTENLSNLASVNKSNSADTILSLSPDTLSLQTDIQPQSNILPMTSNKTQTLVAPTVDSLSSQQTVPKNITNSTSVKPSTVDSLPVSSQIPVDTHILPMQLPTLQSHIHPETISVPITGPQMESSTNLMAQTSPSISSINANPDDSFLLPLEH